MTMHKKFVAFAAFALMLAGGCENSTTPTDSGSSDNNGTQTGEEIPIPPTARTPAQIVLETVSSSEIAVSGTGAEEQATVVYEVRDSLGVAVGATVPVTFSLRFYPNSLVTATTSPRLMPPSASTNSAGQVSISVISGTGAGVVQLIASINVGGGRLVASQPIRISINAGFPDQAHFTVATERLNFPGLDRAFFEDIITVLVADKFSNPVTQRTKVYFHSYHGSITTEGVTDKDGFVKQVLRSSNPWPEGSSALAAGPGWSYVYAQTLGDAGVQIIDSVRILWTGLPFFTNVTGPLGTDAFAIPNGGAAPPWTFEVSDRYGNPMSAGTTINVTGNALKFSGSAVNLKMPDTQSGGPGLTQFTVTAGDDDPTTISVPPVQTTVTIVVEHPVYGTYTRVLATGTVE